MVTDIALFFRKPLFHILRDTITCYSNKMAPPPHYCVNARQILNENIPQQWIGRRGHIEWPARSPDPTVCNFWLWAYLRDRVYQPAGVTFRSVTELENRIHQELNAIPLRMFRDAFRNFQKRCQLCIDVDGNHFEC